MAQKILVGLRWLLGDSPRKICDGLRNLKSVRRTPLVCSHRFVLAILLLLCTLFPARMYALHDVDHRFTVKGRICGPDGEGIGALTVSVKNSRADISGKGKTDSNGFYEVLLHLHNENQGDPLVVQAGEFKTTGRVELDPNDPRTERMVRINLGQPCRPLQIWREAWVLAAFVAIFGMVAILAFRRGGGKEKKRPNGGRKGKGQKR